VPLTISCPGCQKPLAITDALLGKMVRCPACKTTFQAGQEVPVAEAAIQPPPPFSPPVKEEVDDEASDQEERRRKTLAPPPSPRKPVKPFSFKAQVVKDPRKVFKGVIKCRVTDEGLWVKGPTLQELVPIGSEVFYQSGSHFCVPIKGREVELAVSEILLIGERLALDLCAYLSGEGDAPVRKDYLISPVLFATAVLPLGIPIVSLGGAIWAGLGFGLCGLNVTIIRRESWSTSLRLLLSLLTTAVGYGILFAAFWLARPANR